MKKATDPKWVLYRHDVMRNAIGQSIPSVSLSPEQNFDLKNAKEIMKTAVDINHWNELRDRVRELYGNIILSAIDGSALVNKVLKLKTL